MLDVLLKVESDIENILENADFKTLYIDYHKPFVSRIWFPFGEYRVYLHKIEPSGASSDALFHPHPWKSAIRILKGTYEMGIGHSKTNEIPSIDARVNAVPGVSYEMIHPDGWHYVNPKNRPVYSLMVTGELYEREMPVKTNKEFRDLNKQEILEILEVVNEYYSLKLKIKNKNLH